MPPDTLDEVVDKMGPLIEIVPKFEPGTLWTAQQHMNARRTEPDQEKRKDLKNRWYWTYDSALYSVEKDKGAFYLGRGNLIFDNLAEAVQQLQLNQNYRPGEEAANAFKRAPDTVRAALDDLKLRKLYDELSYFVINTSKGREGLNPAQVIVAERPYGQAEDFENNMKMLLDSGIQETRVWILNPNYVKQMAAKEPIARGSWLGSSADDFVFDAVGNLVGFPYAVVRGKVYKAAETN